MEVAFGQLPPTLEVEGLEAVEAWRLGGLEALRNGFGRRLWERIWEEALGGVSRERLLQEVL